MIHSGNSSPWRNLLAPTRPILTWAYWKYAAKTLNHIEGIIMNIKFKQDSNPREIPTRKDPDQTEPVKDPNVKDPNLAPDNNNPINPNTDEPSTK